ncbi:WD40 repeat-like protein [Tulasnella sp. 403]|nr:WD40 repeat-like protein [Tulasnella sp. 403]
MAVSSQKIYSVGFDDTVREIDADKRDFTPLAVSLTSQPRGIATVASGSNTVYIISENAVHVVQDGQQVFTLPVNYKAASIAVATDGSTVAVGSDDTKVYLYEWDGQGLRDVGKLESNRAGVSALSFSPDGVALAAGDSAGKIVVYDVKERKMLTSRWVGHSGRITSLAWTNDSKHCASGSVDTHVYVWSLVKPLRNIPIRNAVPGGVSVVTWLSATTVAGAGADGCVRSWDIQFHA